MSDRSNTQLFLLNAGQSQTFDSQPIPDGVKIQIKEFSGTDINMGDNKSSWYRIQWGVNGNFEEVTTPIAVTGNTSQVKVNREYVGDGNKFFRVTAKNESGSNKYLSFSYKAKDLQ